MLLKLTLVLRSYCNWLAYVFTNRQFFATNSNFNGTSKSSLTTVMLYVFNVRYHVLLDRFDHYVSGPAARRPFNEVPWIGHHEYYYYGSDVL